MRRPTRILLLVLTLLLATYMLMPRDLPFERSVLGQVVAPMTRGGGDNESLSPAEMLYPLPVDFLLLPISPGGLLPGADLSEAGERFAAYAARTAGMAGEDAVCVVGGMYTITQAYLDMSVYAQHTLVELRRAQIEAQSDLTDEERAARLADQYYRSEQQMLDEAIDRYVCLLEAERQGLTRGRREARAYLEGAKEQYEADAMDAIFEGTLHAPGVGESFLDATGLARSDYAERYEIPATLVQLSTAALWEAHRARFDIPLTPQLHDESYRQFIRALRENTSIVFVSEPQRAYRAQAGTGR